MNRYAILLGAGLLAAAAPAKAGIVYDNVSASTGATSDGDAGVTTTDHGPLADSFSTGAAPGSLSDVKLLLSADAPSDGGTATVTLLSDSGTKPGTLLATLGTVNDSALTTSPQETVIDFPVSTAISLAANTRYWIEIGGGNTSANWSYDASNVGVGVANEFNYYAGGVSNNNSFTPYQMTVTTTGAVSAVPLPTAGWVGLSMMGLLSAACKLARHRGLVLR